MNDDLVRFLFSLGMKAETIEDQLGIKVQSESSQYEDPQYEPTSYRFGALDFTPTINANLGIGGSKSRDVAQQQTQGGGRLGGSVRLPSGTSFGGGVSGSYYRGKENFSPRLQEFGEPASVTYGPSGMVNSYDAFVNLPSGVNVSGSYQPQTDDYNIMARIRKEF